MNAVAEDPIRAYWNQRAGAAVDPRQATTDDVYLRELEIATLVQTVHELAMQPKTLLDIGCGDGYSTLAVAKANPGLQVLGIDFSPNMIDIATGRLARENCLADRVRFDVGDATQLSAILGQETYDVILTDRCLINLPTAEAQFEAIRNIAGHVNGGGHYLAIENFTDGQRNLNEARASVGLAPIPMRWHNRFFEPDLFVRAASPFFDAITFADFSSSYYFATRVIYSAMCKMRGEEPDYQHEIHRLAVHLPWTGQFSPIRMVVLRRKQD